MLEAKQREALCTALLSAYPDEAELEMFLDLKLDKKLKLIVTNSPNLRITTWTVIIKAESDDWIDALIIEGHQYNSGNIKLKAFYDEFILTYKASPDPQKKQATAQVSQLSLPLQHQFDLNTIIENAMNIILESDKQSVIGLCIPCLHSGFITSFCERLKIALERGQTTIKSRDELTKKYFSLDESIKTIKRYKKLLQEKNVIYPIVIGNTDKPWINNFWQEVCKESSSDLKKRFIIVLFGEQEESFPDNTALLAAPEFSAAHVHKWVDDVVGNMHCPPAECDTMRDRWYTTMKDECITLAACEHNFIRIKRVYEHLYDTTEILQQNPSCQDFLFALNNRS